MRSDAVDDSPGHYLVTPSWRWWGRLVGWAVLATTIFFGWMLIPVWIAAYTPRWFLRGLSIGFLEGLLGAYVLAIPGLSLGLAVSAAILVRNWASQRAATRAVAARWLLLCTSGLIGLALMEAGAAMVLRRAYRVADLPTHFLDPKAAKYAADMMATVPPLEPAANAPAGPAGTLKELLIVVVGESSARGEPYHPWMSVGQIVAWQLQRVFPGRSIRVQILAQGGFCLEQAIVLLAGLDRKPDAVMVFAGHNEFQTRYGWSRNVRYYVEEGPASRLALLALVRDSSNTGRLILDSLDRFWGETPPPPRVTRELVDHPTCTKEEYAFLREDYARRLNGLARWCTRIGALPILIVPASNDGSYEPSRSILAGSTPEAERVAFAREFQSVRAIESSDPKSAIAAYRGLLTRHPEFAETHYRLARLLIAAGSDAEAHGHSTQARDLDGLPLRCPSDFQQAVRDAAKQNHGLLIDGPVIIGRLCPGGIPDDTQFHDGQHLSLTGQAALAQEILHQLQRRKAFGWPEPAPVPVIDVEECLHSFGIDTGRVAMICSRSASFYGRTAYVRYDPSDRLATSDRYAQASRELSSGTPIEKIGVPSLRSIARAIGHGPDSVGKPRTDEADPAEEGSR